MKSVVAVGQKHFLSCNTKEAGIICYPTAYSLSIRRRLRKGKFRLLEHDTSHWEMLYPGGPGSVRTCHGITLAVFGFTEGFDRSGKEDRLYAFQLSEGVYIRKDVTLEGVGSLTFGELSDLDTSHAVPKKIHTLAFTGSKWVPLRTRSNKQASLLT